jgi:hypothetical protein
MNHVMNTPQDPESQVSKDVVHWDSAAGLLSKIGTQDSSTSIEHFVSLLAGAIFAIRRAKKLPAFNDISLERYGMLAQFISITKR